MPLQPDWSAHPSAVVDEPCRIGQGTRIWHFAHVMADSTIGANCVLGQNVVVAPRVRIGDGVKIQNNVSVYTGVELDDEVFCGPSVVFTNVINPRSHIERKHEFRRTAVGRGATLGANATIVCGITLGRWCFVGAGAVVTRDVPDFALVHGNPARLRGWVCRCGVSLPLAAKGPEGERTACRACGEGYLRTADGLSPEHHA